MGKFSGKKCRLLSMMVLTGFFFFVEIVVGYVTNSMALVADSFHMLGDIAALVISFLSVKVSYDFFYWPAMIPSVHSFCLKSYSNTYLSMLHFFLFMRVRAARTCDF